MREVTMVHAVVWSIVLRIRRNPHMTTQVTQLNWTELNCMVSSVQFRRPLCAGFNMATTWVSWVYLIFYDFAQGEITKYLDRCPFVDIYHSASTRRTRSSTVFDLITSGLTWISGSWTSGRGPSTSVDAVPTGYDSSSSAVRPYKDCVVQTSRYSALRTGITRISRVCARAVHSLYKVFNKFTKQN